MNPSDIPFHLGEGFTNLPAVCWAYFGEDGQNILWTETPMEVVGETPSGVAVQAPSRVRWPATFVMPADDLKALVESLEARAEVLAETVVERDPGEAHLWTLGLAVHDLTPNRIWLSLYAWKSPRVPVGGTPLREFPLGEELTGVITGAWLREGRAPENQETGSHQGVGSADRR